MRLIPGHLKFDKLESLWSLVAGLKYTLSLNKGPDLALGGKMLTYNKYLLLDRILVMDADPRTRETSSKKLTPIPSLFFDKLRCLWGSANLPHLNVHAGVLYIFIYIFHIYLHIYIKDSLFTQIFCVCYECTTESNHLNSSQVIRNQILARLFPKCFP